MSIEDKKKHAELYEDGDMAPLEVTEELVQRWSELQAQLADVKVEEMELRKVISDHILKGKEQGAKKGAVGIYKLTATTKTNVGIDREELQVLWSDLTPAEKACVKFDPKLIAKEYKTLDTKSNLHRAITHKPGSPTLKINSVKKG